MKKIRLLCITCARKDLSYNKQVELACQGGADMIQLRDKTMSDTELFNLCIELKNICKKHGVYFPSIKYM